MSRPVLARSSLFGSLPSCCPSEPAHHGHYHTVAVIGDMLQLCVQAIIIVVFFSSLSFRRNLNISLLPAGSRPTVGSSRAGISGFIAITPRNGPFFFWPPEAQRSLSRTSSGNPVISAASSTRFSVSASGTPIF